MLLEPSDHRYNEKATSQAKGRQSVFTSVERGRGCADRTGESYVGAEAMRGGLVVSIWARTMMP